MDGLCLLIDFTTCSTIGDGWISMANCYHHAESSVRKFKGKIEDYIKIHLWYDESKSHYADFRHRALRHHSFGIWQSEQVFGLTITNSDGIVVPVRFIGEQHVREDLGCIPTVSDWFKHIKPESWMMRGNKIEDKSSVTTLISLKENELRRD